MFTGIIAGMGEVTKLDRERANASAMLMRVKLGKSSKGIRIGDSIAINGVCLTVTRTRDGDVDFELIGETMKKTTMGDLRVGSEVNIERSLRLGDRLDGHFVFGHVDGVGKISNIIKRKDEVQVWIGLPETLSGYAVKKGSIAVEGVSLTIVEATKDRFSVSLIPHTLQVTNLGLKRVGDRVNIEADMLMRYVLSAKAR
jgi:riboflavin synthase